MITGTSFFPNRRAAETYFAPYSDDAAAEVTIKLREGEISIGIKPICKANEKVILIDNGTRYAITTA